MVRNIRLAEAADLNEILDVCEKHHASVPFGVLPFSRKKVFSILDNAVRGDRTKACLFVSVAGRTIVGVFLAAVAEVTFSEVPVANEVAFWLLPGYRKSRRVVELIQAFEYWGKNIAKVDYSLLSRTPTEDETERAFSHLGYTKIETNYLKRL